MIEIYIQNLGGVHFAVALNQREIAASTFSNHHSTALNRILSSLPFNVPFQVLHQPTPYAQMLLDALRGIYDGKDVNTEFCLATAGMSSYTRKVLHATLAIPVGYVTSYGAIASAVGGGSRAVGNAMACNIFAPIVPCHRVVKSDFGLGGYSAGGLGVKLEFLKREKHGYTQPKSLMICSAQLCVFPVEQVLSKYLC